MTSCLVAEATIDQLFGGRGNDRLRGGDGNDILIGSTTNLIGERDTLTGGTEADLFVLGMPLGYFMMIATEQLLGETTL